MPYFLRGLFRDSGDHACPKHDDGPVQIGEPSVFSFPDSFDDEDKLLAVLLKKRQLAFESIESLTNLPADRLETAISNLTVDGVIRERSVASYQTQGQDGGAEQIRFLHLD